MSGKELEGVFVGSFLACVGATMAMLAIVAVMLLVQGCDNAGVNKLLGLETGDVQNSGTISIQSVHVEGEGNRGGLDQSDTEVTP